MLDEKGQDQDRDGEGSNVGLEQGGRDLESLDGAQDRYGGCERSVPVEQGSAEETEKNHDLSLRAVFATPRVELRCQGQYAAFAPVIGPQDKHQVLEEDDEDQCPDDE